MLGWSAVGRVSTAGWSGRCRTRFRPWSGSWCPSRRRPSRAWYRPGSVSAACVSTRWTCLPAPALLWTMPGMALLYVRALASWPELARRDDRGHEHLRVRQGRGDVVDQCRQPCGAFARSWFWRTSLVPIVVAQSRGPVGQRTDEIHLVPTAHEALPESDPVRPGYRHAVGDRVTERHHPDTPVRLGLSRRTPMNATAARTVAAIKARTPTRDGELLPIVHLHRIDSSAW